MIGINWASASWGRKGLTQLVKSIDFKGCVLNYSSFFELELEKIEIVNCIAHEVDFSGANLKEANLRGTDFENSIFRHTNLEKADLVKAKNYMIPPAVNTLKKTRFSMPEAMALLYSMDIVLEEYSQVD
ncbi:MAG TPA: pentapeptide repeat-containing protein [Anaerolineales bacterium]|nr:pentapeptide repeat-containing protein [Anaerolineales bacterium]